MPNQKLVSGRVTVMLALALLLLLTFSLWYRNSDPLTRAEQEYYSQALRELTTELPADLVSFLDPETSREFMANKDGRPFCVITIFRFKDQASALVQNGSGLTGREAFAEFSQRAAPLWLRYGTHPVFATNDSPAFDEEWDLVSVVRYRSRRDFMEIQTNPEFHSILPYRLAATEDNIRLKLPATLIPPPLLALLLILLLPLMIVPLLPGRRLARVSRPLNRPGGQ